MGAEQSKEDAQGTVRRFDLEVDAIKEEWIPQQREKFKAMKAARDERKRSAKDLATVKESTAAKKPELLRSSKGDAVPKRASRQPFTIVDSPEPGEVSASDESSGMLDSWKPRKQPLKTVVSGNEQSSSEDEFVGFGNTLSTQQAASQGTISHVASNKSGASASSSNKAPSAGSKAQNATTLAASAGQQQSSNPKTSKSDFFKGTQSSNKKATAPPAINTDVQPAKTPASATTATSASAKRPATSAFADERRSIVAKALKRSSVASPQSPTGAAPSIASTGKIPKKSSGTSRQTAEKTVTSIEERPPPWYKALKATKTRKPNEATAAQILTGLKSDMSQCKKPTFRNNRTNANKTFDNIRKRLHTIPFELVSGQLLRDHRMLHDEEGLPQLFDSQYSDSIPKDIQADAQEQYNKWCMQNFETDLLHHIIRGKPKGLSGDKDSKTVDTIDPSYQRVSARYFGNGLLLNGQWWPTLLTAYRDGAHGDNMKGIVGAKGEGAYSCLISTGEGYENVDHGEWVLYCGTDSASGAITTETEWLLENEKNGRPVRFIRSHNVGGQWAPEIGFRYDGLYNVESHEMMDAPASLRQRHRFKLVRTPGQDPIRGGKGPERRPTDQEMEAHLKDKRLRGFT